MRSTAKTKHKRRFEAQQASRRLKPAPKQLQAIFYLVNLVPGDVELVDMFERWDELKKEVVAEYETWHKTRRQELGIDTESLGPPNGSADDLDRALAYSQKMLDYSGEVIEKSEALIDWHIKATVKAINQCLTGLPKTFRDYVWQVGEESSQIDDALVEAIVRYTFVRESRDKLRLISRIANAENPQENLALAAQLRSYAQIMIDDSGELYLAKDKFASAIDGVEAKRIRECEICRRIFWAGRIDQPSCSTACAHALRNRRYRARYKDYLVRQHLKENGTTAAGTKPHKTGKGKTKKGS
jgi:hypothetical protein